MNIGCNTGIAAGCIDHCAALAIPGVKETFEFDDIQKITIQFAKELKEARPMPFFSSDLTDYRSKNGAGDWKSGVDIVRLWIDVADFVPNVSSAIGRGKFEVAWQMSKMGALNRVSTNDSETNAKHREKWGIDRTKGKRHKNLQPLHLSSQSSTALSALMGIGCFTGGLMTPRGFYSVIPLLGVRDNDAFPTGEAIIPYSGEQPVVPSPGDDVRIVLSQHLPLIAHESFDCPIIHLHGCILPKTVGKYQDRLSNQMIENCFLIQDPNSNGILIVYFLGSTVTRILAPEEVDIASTASLDVVVKNALHGTKYANNRMLSLSLMRQCAQSEIIRKALSMDNVDIYQWYKTILNEDEI